MREADDAVAILLRYEHWCTDKLGAKIEQVAAPDLVRTFAIGHKTLHASFYHLVTVAEKWTDRSRPVPTGLIGKTYPGVESVTIAQLRERYRAAASQMLLNNAALNAVIEPDRGDEWEIKRNHLIHITTHGMHHRGR